MSVIAYKKSSHIVYMGFTEKWNDSASQQPSIHFHQCSYLNNFKCVDVAVDLYPSHWLKSEMKI